MEARDERRQLRLEKQIATSKLLFVNELGFVPLSKTGVEFLFELISQHYERGATVITSNLPFDEWPETLGSERLTGVQLDHITHQVKILEMNGESYRLAQSRARKAGRNLSQNADTASAKLWSGYALPAFHARGAQWSTFARPLTIWCLILGRWEYVKARRGYGLAQRPYRTMQ